MECNFKFLLLASHLLWIDKKLIVELIFLLVHGFLGSTFFVVNRRSIHIYKEYLLATPHKKILTFLETPYYGQVVVPTSNNCDNNDTTHNIIHSFYLSQ